MTQHISQQTIIPIAFSESDTWETATEPYRKDGFTVERCPTLCAVDGKIIRIALAFGKAGSQIVEPRG